MNLPATHKERMERLPGVDSVFHFTWFNGIYMNEPKNFFASLPVSDLETMLRMYPEYHLEASHKEAFGKTRTGAIIGRTLADRE
jgi:putative ABC transport system permease protein